MVRLNRTNHFVQISPKNEALKFLSRRLLSDKYRGMHYSQHNRYDISDVRKILDSLGRHASFGGLLPIRTTDMAKRGTLKDDEIAYGRFCDDVKTSTKKGTQDSIRKTLFPDFHRMGLIYRYDKDRRRVDPFAKSKRIKYVSLTPLGKRMVESNTHDACNIYSRCIIKLLEGAIKPLLYVLRDAGLKSVDQYEYAFFISAVDADPDFRLTESEAADKIEQYRILSPSQRRDVIETLKDDLLPTMRSKRKPDRRDFHNWTNEARQVYSLLDQTGCFASQGNQLTLTNIPKLENILYTL